ncbi:MAG: hypothetical protein A3B90_02780 [Candidatus Magasanikbacteria bacterium RIFCSPHIGHO2_02_FULL_41_13]|uniref:inorganic diphosphatase n=1 Tax=Candidatus Magasanikbacteria bacterium RIFCSPHIGHO2_02_FULL_41_13 TaxID=1798676 RepID=A0A1F6M4Z9_9BACT|nr:MAG: hypothetical protein A3B90_02780 [Candidatus Magasanikbacteria bacterium RIFCSPHIGHO2_02_FULL_41_13]
MFQAVIEMPEGDTRRRHMRHDQTGIVDLGVLKEKVPVNNGVMPINYGFIPNTKNPAEGDELDVIIFSEEKLEVGEQVDFNVIALLRRADGDDKIVGVDTRNKNLFESWEDISAPLQNLVLEFFAYIAPIIKIESKENAENYILENTI